MADVCKNKGGHVGALGECLVCTAEAGEVCKRNLDMAFSHKLPRSGDRRKRIGRKRNAAETEIAHLESLMSSSNDEERGELRERIEQLKAELGK